MSTCNQHSCGRPMPMFAILFCILLACSAFGAENAPDPVGIWQGALEAQGTKLRVVVHVARDAGGALTGTMDSPDQGAKGMPIVALIADATKFAFRVDLIGGRYEGAFAADGDHITGTWVQGPVSLPLTLRRDADVPVARRPQEPQRPLPYVEEEVSYQSTPGVTLGATLALPPGNGPFPAAVLITGSGPQDRDESVAGHRPFLVLSDALTRRGIAVLRADDRDIGKSKGGAEGATSADFAVDALAGVHYLLSRKEIDTAHIGLVGHSEGGLIAPLAATSDAPEARQVAFLVLIAGPGVPLGEILIDQQRSCCVRVAAGGADDGGLGLTTRPVRRRRLRCKVV